MVDGASGVSLMSLLFRSDPDVYIPPAGPWVPRPRPSPLRLALDEVATRSRQTLSLPSGLMAAIRQPREMSYDGRLCWGLMADRDLAPDLPAMAGDLDAALAELLEAAPAGAAGVLPQQSASRKGAHVGRESPSS
jgi:hypothetical protein